MPRKLSPRIADVQATAEPFTLHLCWSNGAESDVDLADMIHAYRVYEPLHHSPELFSQVQRGDLGTDIVWTDDLDMAAETLWRLTQEQSGLTMSAQAFRNWRERQSYTLDAAAHALGLSRRMVAYYEQGTKPVPRVVALATRALELT